ncbi:MAG: hypothetical protein GX334_05320 [Firmicutes bacterium]|nr:hypothetical protein [Bacillota bacterium]
MEKMKSALEIALEKAKKMGSPDKKGDRELESQKYIQAALSLGSAFLQGKIGAEKIVENLRRYPEESREAAREAFLGAITKEMDLANTPQILDAVLLLQKDAGVQAACTTLKTFHQQLQQQLQTQKAALQANSFEPLLEKMGLTGLGGSALVGFNTQHLPGWEETKAQLLADYEEQLQHFRKALPGSK